MFMFNFRYLLLGLIGCLLAAEAIPQEKKSKRTGVTYADAAIIFAKYSGQFDRYISPDASLSECVKFLNNIGISFNLKSILNREEFTLKDCARVMGQIFLLFRGDAEFDFGKVSLPEEAGSWEDYCLLYDIKYREVYDAMIEKAEKLKLKVR